MAPKAEKTIQGALRRYNVRPEEAARLADAIEAKIAEEQIDGSSLTFVGVGDSGEPKRVTLDLGSASTSGE